LIVSVRNKSDVKFKLNGGIMKFNKYILMLIISLFFLACSEEKHDSIFDTNTANESNLTDLESFNSEAEGSLAKGIIGKPVRVMTRNIYIGTDVDVVLKTSTPDSIPILAAQAFQVLQSTNFPERAVSLAKEIAFTRPHLVGLQEVSKIRLQDPGDLLDGGTTPAEYVLMDYLEIFMATLGAMGLDYQVAAKIENVDVELPMVIPDGSVPVGYHFADVRVTDYDVILARHDVMVSNETEQNYQVNLKIDDLGIELKRGYVAVDAKIGKQTYRFVNTHLEPFYLPVRQAQLQELLTSLSGENLPVIMVGDFNTQAPNGETYISVTGNGFTDTWTENILPFNPEGLTYGHDPNLRNAFPDFWERIDFIFTRDGADGSVFKNKSLAIVVGDEQFNRTETGLWPSDHAGVVAQLKLNPGRINM
jgi:endonuclease/exonuclease/phosphatase family metal-dependent hydrolase